MKKLIVVICFIICGICFGANTIHTVVINVAAAGTEVVVSATKLEVSQVCFKAAAANTNNIYIGDSTVTSTNGYFLAPSGELCLGGLYKDKPIDLGKVYIDADTNANKVRILYQAK